MRDTGAWQPTDTQILELWNTAEQNERGPHGTELENNNGGRPGHPHCNRASSHPVAADGDPDRLGHDRRNHGDGHRPAGGGRPQRTIGTLGAVLSAT